MDLVQVSISVFCLLLTLVQQGYGTKMLHPYVTCGSLVKLINNHYKVRLHSHDVKYGSGSGQQSVTGSGSGDDVNSLWLIKGTADKPCQRGEPVQCGSAIRLEHTTTNKNLHSHLFSSPLSGNQEVSAYGKKGEGDTGDNWTLTCSEDNWERESAVRFKHVDTEMWLSTSGRSYGRPIDGQLEIVGVSYPDASSYWKVADGVYIKPTEPLETDAKHDEL